VHPSSSTSADGEQGETGDNCREKVSTTKTRKARRREERKKNSFSPLLFLEAKKRGVIRDA